ncbi:MAG: hypothetical protein HON78_01510 [Legionellales bacterium]|jgi:DNA-nicking Smr family endonuclease|nr:hypothetical protein [Legionellales bacterium]
MTNDSKNNDHNLFKDAIDNLKINRNHKKERKIKIEIIDSYNKEEILTATDSIEFMRAGVRLKEFRQLKKGQMNTKEELDLHGLTQREAKTAVISFIEYLQENNLKYAKIIHGKGISSNTPALPAIKNLINNILRNIPVILAFCSAKPYDGGTGAVYIMIKSQRSNDEQ